MRTKEEVQQARQRLVTLNRIWRQIPSSAPLSDEQICRDIGAAFLELIRITRDQTALELDYITVSSGKIYGFTSPMIRTFEHSFHLHEPLTHVLHTRLPGFIRSGSVQDTWCQLVDVLAYDLMAEKAYTAMEQISGEEWDEIVRRSTELVREGEDASIL